jgi:aryl-alcohol dehydrogenase-like predicted oxidoreductase
MKYNRLGNSGLRVSEVGLGCNNFGMRIDAEQSASVVTAALEAGINFFDTADVYGECQSEEFLGKALGMRRRDVIVATKFGMSLRGSEQNSGGSRRWIMEAVEHSLRRLGSEYIDLYQMHQPDPVVPLEETLRALDDLVVQGKVRHIGCCNFSARHMGDARNKASVFGTGQFVSAQIEYSLLARDAEREILPACEGSGLGVLPYFPLASGLLTGKYRRGEAPPGGSRIAAWGAAAAQVLRGEKMVLVERLTAWANGRGHTILELAFGWLLARAPVASVIAGATTAEQVCANAAAPWTLTPEELAEVRAILVQ